MQQKFPCPNNFPMTKWRTSYDKAYTWGLRVTIRVQNNTFIRYLFHT
jgi:hypothetical protein